jgi:hypothetical protein
MSKSQARRTELEKITYVLNNISSRSFVISSGRFCMKRILLGGRYSSGICTIRRVEAEGTGTGACPEATEAAAAIVSSKFWESRVSITASLCMVSNTKDSGITFCLGFFLGEMFPPQRIVTSRYFYLILSSGF